MTETLLVFNGILLGVLITLALECYAVYRWIVRPWLDQNSGVIDAADPDQEETTSKDEPGSEKDAFKSFHHNWPSHIHEYLKNMLDTRQNHQDQAHTWLNCVFQRYFIECRASDVFKIRLRHRLMEKLSTRFQGGGSIVQGIEITDIDVGEYAPVIKNVELLKNADVMNSLDVTTQFDLQYEGGLKVSFEANLTLGIRIPVSVRMNGFTGRLQLRYPSPWNSAQYAVAFDQDPGMSFEVNSSFWRKENEMLKDVLNSFIARRLRTIFLESFVLPNWRSFDMPLVTYRRMFIPELEDLIPGGKHKHGSPRLENGVAKRGIGNTLKGLAFKQTNSMQSTSSPDSTKETATVTNDSRFLSRRRADIKDALASKCFSVDVTVNVKNINRFQELLVTQFLRLALERTVSDVQEEQNGANPNIPRFEADRWLSSSWTTMKARKGVNVQKKSIAVDGSRADVFRAIFQIEKCTAEKASQVLVNPEHLRHVEDSYVESHVLQRFDDNRCIRRFTYRIGRGVKYINTLEVRTTVGEDSYLIVYRSVTPLSNMQEGDSEMEMNTRQVKTSPSPQRTPERSNSASMLLTTTHTSKAPASASINVENITAELTHEMSPRKMSNAALGSTKPIYPSANAFTPVLPENLGLIYVFGYLVEPAAGRTDSCQVTVMSQFGSPPLQRLDVNWNRCNKLKMFVEELAQWTALVESKKEPRRIRDILANRGSGSSEMDIEGPSTSRRASDGERWRMLLHYTLGIRKFMNIRHQKSAVPDSDLHIHQRQRRNQFSNSSSNHSGLLQRSLSDGNIDYTTDEDGEDDFVSLEALSRFQTPVGKHLSPIFSDTSE